MACVPRRRHRGDARAAPGGAQPRASRFSATGPSTRSRPPTSTSSSRRSRRRASGARRSARASSTSPPCSTSAASSRTRPASKSIRLPHEEHEEISPPAASHVEAVYERVDDVYRLPLLLLDWSGARVSSIYEARVGDYDRINRRVRLRASTTKTRKALWIELPDVLATAIERTLGNDVDAPIFEGNANALRTAIARACRDAGVPVFSPHDLRHRRIACSTTRAARGRRSPASSASESCR